MSRYARLAFTAGVRQAQKEYGSEDANARRMSMQDGSDRFSSSEASFIEERDGFYIATVSETGWPYLQFRGGPRGFIRVLDEHTFAYAIVRGNRQYITIGNLRTEDRVALFFMDYSRQQRLKVYGRAEVLRLDDDPELIEQIGAVRSAGPVEAVMRIHLEGFSWNCPKNITPRFTIDELEELLAPVRDQMSRIEAENGQLRAQLAAVLSEQP